MRRDGDHPREALRRREAAAARAPRPPAARGDREGDARRRARGHERRASDRARDRGHRRGPRRAASPCATRGASTTPIEVLRDPDDRGHSEAATLGIIRALALGAECTALLPGDCPLLDPDELDARPGTDETRPGRRRSRPSRDRDQRASCWRPPTRSARRSARAARTATAIGPGGPGYEVAIEPLESLALDLDTPDDLDALAAALAERPERAPADRRGAAASWVRSPDARMSAEARDRADRAVCPRSPRATTLGGADRRRGRRARGSSPIDGDVIVVSQKVVSKAEGRIRRLAAVEPGERADELAAALGKDPRMVELVLVGVAPGRPREPRGADRRDARRLDLRERRDRLLERSRRRDRRPCCRATPTPRRAGSAAQLARGLRRGPASWSPTASGARGGSARRTSRSAAPASSPLDDWRGRRDAHGDELAATAIAVADELAAAADLAREQGLRRSRRS